MSNSDSIGMVATMPRRPAYLTKYRDSKDVDHFTWEDDFAYTYGDFPSPTDAIAYAESQGWPLGVPA